MNITFYGAVREVTGSMHLLSTEKDRILLDCGLFQGRRKETEQKNRMLPVDPKTLTTLVLSHAHIDHSGRIPLLVQGGFNGRVVCTRATAAACGYLLPDSAHIQESDAAYLNYKAVRNYLSQPGAGSTPGGRENRDIQEIKKLLKKDQHRLNTEAIQQIIETHGLDGVKPLYTVADAERSLGYFDGYPYRTPVTIGRNVTCSLYDAGHILGSAISVIRAAKNGRFVTLCYTGDLGRFGAPIIENPTLDFAEEDREVDLMILESTYGNRTHEPAGNLKDQLKAALTETLEKGGSVLIPAFAYGRTQGLLYLLHELYDAGETPKVPVYIDSPLATNITRVFGEHPEVYNDETHETFLQKGKNPFAFGQVRFVESVEESMEIMRLQSPHIVIAASGMCEAGRILHHLRYKIHQERNTILIVGFMAQHTLGRRILESGLEYEASGRKGPPPQMKILNKTYPLKAGVVKLDGFSAHADKEEMLRFLRESNLKVKKIALVHGEEEQTLMFSKHLQEAGYPVVVPTPGETVEVG